MAPVVIEPARISDWLAIGRLVAANFPHEHRERVAYWLCWRLPYLQVARRQGRVVGCFHVKPHEPAGVLWLDMIAVAAEARGLGIAQLMLERIEQIGAACDCRRIGLQCLDSNESALNLYRRTGFDVVRRERWQDYGVEIVVHERRIPDALLAARFPAPQPHGRLRCLLHVLLYRTLVRRRLPLPTQREVSESLPPVPVAASLSDRIPT